MINLAEKLSRYCQIARYAGNEDYQKNHEFVINDSAQYKVISRFDDPISSVAGYILQKLYDSQETANEENPRKDKYVLSFCGSKDFKDWVTDFMFSQVPWPYADLKNDMSKVKIHKGFINQYSACRNKIIREFSDIIKELSSEGIKPSITICGHSLGGALATLATMDLYNLFGDVADISSYTFGSPRVFNKKGSELYTKKSQYAYRVANMNDIVTLVPMAIMGYSHVGSYIHINKNLTIDTNPNGIFPLFASAIDHLIENYCNALKTILNRDSIRKSIDVLEK